MIKSLRNVILTRSRLKNRLNGTRSETNWNKYKKQINFCVSLLRKTKRVVQQPECQKFIQQKNVLEKGKTFFSLTRV